MRHSTTPRYLTWLGVLAAVVMLSSACGDDSADADLDQDTTTTVPPASDEVDDEPVADSVPIETDDLTVAEAVLRDVNPRIGLVIRTEEGLFVDISRTGELAGEARALIAEAVDTLPEAEELTAILDALVAWDLDIADAMSTLEAEDSRLQQEVTAWLETEPRDGPPPKEYTDLLDRILFGHEAYKRACLGFGASYGLAPDCNSIDRDPSEGSPEDVGEIVATMGDIELAVQPGVVNGSLVNDGNIGLELTPTTTLTILLPPAVANPAMELDALDVVNPIPWPDDAAAWAEALPVTVESTGSLVLNGRDFETTQITFGGVQFAIVVNDGYPEGANIISSGTVIQWWETTVEGQPVVAVMDSYGGEELDPLIEVVEQILGSMTATI